MPLNIRVDNLSAYAGALLEPAQSIEEILQSIPGFKGFWSASEGFAVGASALWTPRHGSGSWSQATLGRAPVAASQGGLDVIRFPDAYSGFMAIADAPEMAAATALTVGLRFFLRTLAPPDYIFDGFSTGPVIFSDANSVLNYNHKGASAPVSGLPLLSPGWHTLILMHAGSGPATISLDGVSVSVPKALAMSLENLVLGARTSSSRAAKMDLRSALLAFGVPSDPQTISHLRQILEG